MALGSGLEFPLLPGSWDPQIPRARELAGQTVTRGPKQTLVSKHTLELPQLQAGGQAGDKESVP